MTVQEKLEQMLIDNGMFPAQAKEVMVLAIPELNHISDGYMITWSRNSEEYDQSIYRVLYHLIRPIALKWIEDNKPQAWFKPMFE